jgi:hypothetical protein
MINPHHMTKPSLVVIEWDPFQGAFVGQGKWLRLGGDGFRAAGSDETLHGDRDQLFWVHSDEERSVRSRWRVLPVTLLRLHKMLTRANRTDKNNQFLFPIGTGRIGRQRGRR